jgi:hypothetical protein
MWLLLVCASGISGLPIAMCFASVSVHPHVVRRRWKLLLGDNCMSCHLPETVHTCIEQCRGSMLVLTLRTTTRCTGEMCKWCKAYAKVACGVQCMCNNPACCVQCWIWHTTACMQTSQYTAQGVPSCTARGTWNCIDAGTAFGTLACYPSFSQSMARPMNVCRDIAKLCIMQWTVL